MKLKEYESEREESDEGEKETDSIQEVTSDEIVSEIICVKPRMVYVSTSKRGMCRDRKKLILSQARSERNHEGFGCNTELGYEIARERQQAGQRD